MAEHEVLVEELKNWIKRAGTVTAEEVLEWARKRGISSLALYVFVEEVLDDESIDGSSDTVLIDETFDLHIPAHIYYRAKEQAQKIEGQAEAPELPEKETALREKKVEEITSKPKKVDILSLLGPPNASSDKSTPVGGEKGVARKTVRRLKKKRARKAPRAQGGLLEFIKQISAPEEVKGKEAVWAEKKEISEELRPKNGVEKKVNEQKLEEGRILDYEELDAINKLLKDERFEKAIRYLNNYWSVGIYRFYEDMQRMGVEEPKKILYELLKKKLVEIVDPGVVNAKDSIRKLRLRREVRLSDLVKGKQGL